MTHIDHSPEYGAAPTGDREFLIRYVKARGLSVDGSETDEELQEAYVSLLDKSMTQSQQRAFCCRMRQLASRR